MDGPLAHISPRVRGLRPSATVAINERCNALIAAGRTVYKLGTVPRCNPSRRAWSRRSSGSPRG